MSVIKFIDAPGSLTFLLFLCLIGLGLAWIWPRNRRVSRLWFLGAFALYGVLGLPWVANAIANRLTTFRPLERIDPGQFDTVVIFDGDNRRGRLREAVRILELTPPKPFWVLSVGEDWLVEELAAAGLPRERIHHETRTYTTRDQIAWLGRFMAAHPDVRPAVIASRLQMPRVAALLQRAGLEAVVIPGAIDDEPTSEGVWQFVPTYIGLRTSRDAIYELAALAWYRWNGWIGPPSGQISQPADK